MNSSYWKTANKCGSLVSLQGSISFPVNIGGDSLSKQMHDVFVQTKGRTRTTYFERTFVRCFVLEHACELHAVNMNDHQLRNTRKPTACKTRLQCFVSGTGDPQSPKFIRSLFSVKRRPICPHVHSGNVLLPACKFRPSSRRGVLPRWSS